MLSFFPVGPEPVPSPLPSPHPGAGPRPPPTLGPAWEDSGLALLLQRNHRETEKGEGFGLVSWERSGGHKGSPGPHPHDRLSTSHSREKHTLHELLP